MSIYFILNQYNVLAFNVDLASKNLSKHWTLGDYSVKDKIQRAVFPEVVVINPDKIEYLTKNKKFDDANKTGKIKGFGVFRHKKSRYFYRLVFSSSGGRTNI